MNRSSSRWPLVAALALATFLPVPLPTATAVASSSRAVEKVAKKAITSSKAKKVGAKLAGKDFLGRGTGQEGNEKAARWLAAELLEAGWEAGIDPEAEEPVDGCLQWFDVKGPRVKSREGVRSPNVVVVLPGSGVDQRASVTAKEESEARSGADEVLVIGAHFDHLGVPGGLDPAKYKKPNLKRVYWGADDNASGSTALLLLARALGGLAKQGIHARRTIVLIFFTGEEMGLLGSAHYAANPVRPMANTVAMLNIDMVGRNDTRVVEVYGHNTSPELASAHKEALKVSKLRCEYPIGDPKKNYFARSDQYNFYKHDIPVMFVFGGMHNDYHKTTDTPEKLNFKKIELVSRHFFEMAWIIANRKDRPTFHKIDLKGAGGRLGVAVEPCTREELEGLKLDEGRGAVRVAAVFDGGLAERLLEPGDLIYSWNGTPLHADDPVARFQSFVALARRGNKVVLRFRRGTKKKAASVKF
ncbi:MAG: M28 family peptidase [Planctomycetota bacterium]